MYIICSWYKQSGYKLYYFSNHNIGWTVELDILTPVITLDHIRTS